THSTIVSGALHVSLAILCGLGMLPSAPTPSKLAVRTIWHESPDDQPVEWMNVPVEISGDDAGGAGAEVPLFQAVFATEAAEGTAPQLDVEGLAGALTENLTPAALSRAV